MNPHRKPASEADVKKAREEGRLEGAEFGVMCLLFAQMDKCGADREFLHNSNVYLDDIFDSISKDYIDYNDIRQTLQEEYGIEVHFG